MQLFLKRNRWVILVAGALIQIFTGVPAAFSVFNKSICNTYNVSNNITSLIFSIIICFFGVGCVIGGFLQDKKGPRFAGVLGSFFLSFGFIASSFLPNGSAILFYIFFSVPVGMGMALLYPAVMSCAQKWYNNQKGFATGVIGGAVGLSGGVLTLLGTWLINTWNIRVAFFVLGLIIAVICTLSCIVLENPNKHECTDNSANNNKYCNTVYANKKTTDKSQSQPKNSLSHNNTIYQIFKTRQYYLLTFAVCFANPAMILFSPSIVEIAQNRGLTQTLALWCIALGSLFSAAGRLFMPWLSDKLGRKTVLLILFCVLFLSSIAFYFAKYIFVIIIYCLLAFCYSGEAAVLPSTVTDLYGQKNTGVHYGFVALGMSVGSIVFPLIAMCFQNSESAKHIIAIVATFAGLICILLLKPTNGKKL